MIYIIDKVEKYGKFLITANYNDFVIDIIPGRYEYFYVNGHKFDRYYLN